MDDHDELLARWIRRLETYFPGVDRGEGFHFLFAADVLEAAGEPVLADIQSADRVYRLTVRPGRRAPVVVRAQLDE